VEVRPAVAALGASMLVLAACASSGPHTRPAERPVARPSPAQPSGPPTAGTTEDGIASWYGEPYHGRATASGRRYDMWEMTAAHRTLPFGTRVHVHNLANDRTAEVIINDRGPFVAGRILDLSRAAAETLDAIGPGVIPVRLEIVALGDGMPNAPCWEVQVGAFGVKENAERARRVLEAKGLSVRFAPASGGLTRVRASAAGGKGGAEALAHSLALEFPGATPVPCVGGW
jgi:rare lipoprotein A